MLLAFMFTLTSIPVYFHAIVNALGGFLHFLVVSLVPFLKPFEPPKTQAQFLSQTIPGGSQENNTLHLLNQDCTLADIRSNCYARERSRDNLL